MNVMYLIRKANLEDMKGIQSVAKISWNTTYEGIIPIEIQESFLSSAYSDLMMENRLKRSFLFVAEANGRVVGFANFSPIQEDGEVELGAIYLHPENQGQGLGTELLQYGIENISGVKKIYINVEKENKIGRTFYEAKGFKKISEFDDDFDGHILKTVRMVLVLED